MSHDNFNTFDDMLNSSMLNSCLLGSNLRLPMSGACHDMLCCSSLQQLMCLLHSLQPRINGPALCCLCLCPA